MTAQALRRPTSRAAEATNDSSGNPDPGKDPWEADKRENSPALSRVVKAEVISMETRARTNAAPLEERIRMRAYQLYVERGNESGSELDDWLQAEEEIAAAEEEWMERD